MVEGRYMVRIYFPFPVDALARSFRYHFCPWFSLVCLSPVDLEWAYLGLRACLEWHEYQARVEKPMNMRKKRERRKMSDDDQ